jgi:ketosteroid isomerase-like protein
MRMASLIFSKLMLVLLLHDCLIAQTTQQRPRSVAARRATTATAAAVIADSRLTGVYRLDLESSDKLYSVVSGASSNLPFGEQQRFFIDLTIRLTPPDQLAIEQRGHTISIASSRAPRITFDASGITRSERAGGDGHIVRTRALLDNRQLTVSTSGNSEDSFTVTFEPLEDGRRLRVTRRIYAAELNSPVVIHSVYNKISEVAQWSIYGEPATTTTPPEDLSGFSSPKVETPVARAERDEAVMLRASLEQWIAATNARDIAKQMTFYPQTIQAFYRTRNVPKEAVRAEKARIFKQARRIDVRADEPEIIFTDEGRAALMRFRKRYVIEGGPGDRRGEVIQELRWRKTGSGWKITSERDVRVLR